MDDWKQIAYKVAIYAFLFEVRPLESYLTAYLTGPNGNVSLFEVANPMEMIKSYSALMATAIMLAVPEYLYKPGIVAFTFCSFAAYSLLIVGSPGLTQLRVSIAGISATSNTYVLAFSYLYAQIDDKSRYQEATSVAFVSFQLGIFVGCVLSQTIVSTSGGVYTALPYFNTFAMFLAVICVYLFPSAKRKRLSLMVDTMNENTGLLKSGTKNPMESRGKNIIVNKMRKLKSVVKITSKELLLAFKTSYSDVVVLKRSLWYIMRMAVHLQIITNINVLYTYIVNKPGNHDVMFNGDAEAMVTLCGAAGAYLIGKVRLDWTYYSDLFIMVCSILTGTLMMSCYFYDHLIFVYVSYIVYGLINQMTLVLNFSEIAKRLHNHCHSLVLGFNLFGSLFTSALLTTFFVQINFLDITIPERFLFIGGLDIFVGIIFLLLILLKMTRTQ